MLAQALGRSCFPCWAGSGMFPMLGRFWGMLGRFMGMDGRAIAGRFWGMAGRVMPPPPGVPCRRRRACHAAAPRACHAPAALGVGRFRGTQESE